MLLHLRGALSKIKDENFFFGPYEDHEFNGKEAEVIIYVTSENLRMQTMARARRLLILVTHPGYSGYWKDDSESVKVMNSAIEQKVVQKKFRPRCAAPAAAAASEIGKLTKRRRNNVTPRHDKLLRDMEGREGAREREGEGQILISQE